MRELHFELDERTRELRDTIREICHEYVHTRGTTVGERVRMVDGERIIEEAEFPAATWEAKAPRETVDQLADDLDSFADRFEQAMAAYDEVDHYLTALAVVWCLVYLALLILAMREVVKHVRRWMVTPLDDRE